MMRAVLRALWRSFPLVVFLVLLTTPILAQFDDTTGRWRRLDIAVATGFPHDNETASSIFFRDTSIGFWKGVSDRLYQTSNGGMTWDSVATFIPVPHTILAGGFGWSEPGNTDFDRVTGFVTYDSGSTWRALAPGKTPSPPQVNVARDLTASPSGLMICLYELQDGLGHQIGSRRLALSRDSGKTWIPLDTAIADARGVPYLKWDSTSFGSLPAPDSVRLVDGGVEWHAIADSVRGDTLCALSSASGIVDGRRVTTYYLGLLDLATRSAVWRRFPRDYVSMPGVSAMPPYQLHSLDEGTFAIIERTTGAPSAPRLFWKTRNSGRSWDSVPTPASMDYLRLRFMSPTFGFCRNFKTYDGGSTWRTFNTPGGVTTVWALDSARYYAGGGGSMFAWSSDAGHHWKRNLAGLPAIALVAFDEHVVIARKHASILVSSNAGISWSIVDRDGELAPGTTEIHSLAIPDRFNQPNRILAIATITPDTADPFYAIVESRDYGLHWTLGEALPLDDAAPASMQFARAPSGRLIGYIGTPLLASMDTGRTWQPVDGASIPEVGRIVMQDSASGIAIFDGHMQATSDGARSWNATEQLYPGRMIPGTMMSFGNGVYRVVLPDVQQGGREWEVLRTTDGGNTWQASNGGGFEMSGGFYWVDSARCFLVAGGGAIWYSEDGGNRFRQTRGLESGFSSSIRMTSDGRFLYVAGTANDMARYRIEGLSAIPADGSTGSFRSAAIIALPNVVSNLLRLLCEPSDNGKREVLICDPLGRSITGDTRLRIDDAGSMIVIDVALLPNGLYYAMITSGHRLDVVPFMIVR